MPMKRKWTLLDITLVLLAGFTTYIQIYPSKTEIDQTRNILYFASIMLGISLLYFVLWLQEKAKDYISQIQDNTKQIESLKEKMIIQKKFYDIQTRISILENKKASIDPKWVILVIIFVFFYLYLRTNGIVP